jgi:hypothetical protein
MSIRESIQKQKGIATTVALLVVVVASILIARNLFSSPPTITSSAYFTTDDGNTQFVDSTEHLPPFDHDGKPAHRAWVYSTDGGNTKFVAYLERYTPAAQARIESQIADNESGKSRIPISVGPADTEVKKPGAGNPWVSRANFAEASKITKIQTPPGTVAEVVMP